jgi:uncharacterized Zn-binding protein involved in type VI secretion
MSERIARIDDPTDGVCYHPIHDGPFPTGGKIVGGASRTIVEGSPPSRLGDEVRSNCGHYGEIISATGNIYVEGIRTAVVGDKVGNGDYIATIIDGASTVSSDKGITGTYP